MEATRAPAPAAKRVSVGGVIGETFSTYGQNVGTLLGSAIVVFLVVELLNGIILRTDAFLFPLTTIISIAGNALYTGIVVRLVRDVRDGQRHTGIGDLLLAAMPLIVPLIGFGILYGVGVTLGFLLLFVPGLILITIWSVGAPAIVIEKIGPIDAFRRSQRLVSGDGWSVFGVLLITFLIVIGVGIVLSLIANSIGNGEAATWIASIVSSTITAPVAALAASVLYFELSDGTQATRAP